MNETSYIIQVSSVTYSCFLFQEKLKIKWKSVEQDKQPVKRGEDQKIIYAAWEDVVFPVDK